VHLDTPLPQRLPHALDRLGRVAAGAAAEHARAERLPPPGADPPRPSRET
jgi:hypothetical protein